jgi:hypothetical protein
MVKPQTYRIRKPTKVLITCAGGLVVIMLGTMAIVNGFWADNFQRISHKVHRLTQTPSISPGSRYNELDEKPTSPLSREGLSPKETEKVQPHGIEKQATSRAANNENFAEAGENSSLRGSSEPEQTPVSSLGPSPTGRIASAPLPPGFGRMEIKNKISPDVERKLSLPPAAKGEIKPESPGEAKPSTLIAKEDTREPQETFSPAQSGAVPPSSPAPTQVSSGSKLVVQAGQSLTRIVDRNYPENQKIGMGAVILANPTIVREDIIYPGQTLFLPAINFANQTIRLQNHLFYAIYGTYRSTESLKEDTTWLAKKKIHFVVRNIKDSRGIAVHRVFLGGYATEEELKKVFRDAEPETR